MVDVIVGQAPLSVDEVVSVARGGDRVVLDPEARARVAATRAVIEALAVDPNPHYGVSTGFGALATTFIEPDERTRLQRSLIRSHAAGTGPAVEREVVRALMLLRIRTLSTGRTGIRESTLDTYLAVLNAGITPVVHEYGSLGCSGDLAPLALGAPSPLMGEGSLARRLRCARRGRVGPAGCRHRASSSSLRRRASPSSTAPTACSACSLLAV